MQRGLRNNAIICNALQCNTFGPKTNKLPRQDDWSGTLDRIWNIPNGRRSSLIPHRPANNVRLGMYHVALYRKRDHQGPIETRGKWIHWSSPPWHLIFFARLRLRVKPHHTSFKSPNQTSTFLRCDSSPLLPIPPLNRPPCVLLALLGRLILSADSVFVSHAPYACSIDCVVACFHWLG